jgi:transposase
MGASSVRRWVKHFKDGNMDIANQSSCGRPRTAATERNKQKVDELIRKDLRENVQWSSLCSDVQQTSSCASCKTSEEENCHPST